MLGPDQWLEIGAMEIYDETLEYIGIGALEITLLSSDQKEAIIQDAKLDEEYMQLYKAVSKGENINAKYTIQEELLAWNGMVYAPKAMRGKVMKSNHNSKVAGNFGRDRTMELISRNFFWPKMEDDVRRHCNECDNCQRTKAPRPAKHGLQQPLELPCKLWTHISTDFISDLPESSGYTMILVVVNRFTKMAHFIPVSKKDSPLVAKAYLENRWKYHRFPEDVVSNQDETFTGQYFPHRYNYLGMKRSMSTAFHPQTEGQTERLNQVIEVYLRSHCNYAQIDWAEMLAMVEFAYNNSKHSTTKITPFYANYGYEPRTYWPTDIQFRNPVSQMYGHYMTAVHKRLSDQLETVYDSLAKYYNKKRQSIERFEKGELVMLNGQNIRSKGRCRKLDDKMYGPFKILSTGHNDCYCKLELPSWWKINPTFNIAVLERYRGKNPEGEIIEIEADNAG